MGGARFHVFFVFGSLVLHSLGSELFSMKTIETEKFRILVAEHMGMCFGVEGAIHDVEKALRDGPATILGQLAHNPGVQERLTAGGAIDGKLGMRQALTKRVIITAHGASKRDRQRWETSGYEVLDTTCPLVRVAHRKLGELVEGGFFPVIVGKAGHVEVEGMRGDYPMSVVVLVEEDLDLIPDVKKVGVIAQTTQPVDEVRKLVRELRKRRPEVEVVYFDTVCRPTKDRQSSLYQLCRMSDFVLVVGGKNSNNTGKLTETAKRLGCQTRQVEGVRDVKVEWFSGVGVVGITAGTSTQVSDVEEVVKFMRECGQRG